MENSIELIIYQYCIKEGEQQKENRSREIIDGFLKELQDFGWLSKDKNPKALKNFYTKGSPYYFDGYICIEFRAKLAK